MTGSADGSESLTGQTGPEPVVAALRKLSADTLRAADDSPGDIPSLARTFLDQAVPMLDSLDGLAAVAVTQQARDTAAATVVQCVNRYAQGALIHSSLARVSGLLEEARSLAATDSFKDSIDMASQVSSGRAVCWFDDVSPAGIDTAHVQPMYGNVVRDRHLGEVRYSWSRKEVIVPRCAACCAAHERRQRIHKGVALAGGIMLPLLAAVFLYLGFGRGDDWAGPVGGVALAIGLPWLVVIGPVLWHTTGVPWWQRRGLRDYAPIVELRRHGWRLGLGPTGRPGRQRG